MKIICIILLLTFTPVSVYADALAVKAARNTGSTEEREMIGKITSTNTSPGRNALLDVIIEHYLDERGDDTADVATVVDLGCGYPPVTTVEMAKALKGKAKVIGVDINIPAFIITFPYRENVYRAFFDEGNNLVYLEKYLERSKSYIYTKVRTTDKGAEILEVVSKIMNRMVANSERKDYSEDDCSIKFNPVQKFGAGQSNLTFVRGGFELPIEGQADVVRAANVFIPYNPEETQDAVERIGLKLKEGGVLIAGDNEMFLLYEKVKLPDDSYRMVPMELVATADIQEWTDKPEDRPVPQVLGELKTGRHFTYIFLKKSFPQFKEQSTMLKSTFVDVVSRYTTLYDLKEAAWQSSSTISNFVLQKMVEKLNENGVKAYLDSIGYIHLKLEGIPAEPADHEAVTRGA